MTTIVSDTAALPAWIAGPRGTWLVLLLALLVGLGFQGSRNLWDPDEGRYTDVAHNMVASGDWLVPRLDPERPHFTKPPLTYWAIAASFEAFGNGDWAARLPNALAFAATALLVLGLARRLQLPVPPLAAAAWITAWGPVAGANVITTDTLLTLWETLAVYGFVSSGLVTGQRVTRRAGLSLMWLGFGLAFLTKGPPGLLPLAAIVAFVAWRRRGQWLRLLDPLGLALFAAVGLGWYVLLIWHAPDLLDYLLVHETIGRVATGEHHRNAGWLGWLVVYGPTLLIGCLPWGALAALSAWRQRHVDPDGPALAPDTRRFLALWFALPLAILVLAQSRLPLYALPLFVPMTLALASVLGPWGQQRRRAVAALLAASVAALGLKAAAAVFPAHEDAATLAREIGELVGLSDIDEIVFADAPAHYGLRHYLGIIVEQVETEPGVIGPGGYAPPELICDELNTHERLLLIVPARRLDALEAHLASCPHLVERIGPLRNWVVFRSLPPRASGP